ncbi:MAG: MupG family TIM beta-alpha barrel fold protein [Erysipelotrichaceae bacterium]
MKKYGSISVYLSKDNDWDKIEAYINKAVKLGFDEVFSSLHLPELSFEEQLNGIEKLMHIIKENHMRIIFDVGGDTLSIIFTDKEKEAFIKSLEIDAMRLDCYYTQQQVKDIITKLGVKEFVLNASTLKEETLRQQADLIRSIENNLLISACHNFYIREESGISVSYMQAQNTMIKQYGMKISAFVPSLNCPRGPLFLGLPTLEKHRCCDITLAALELLYLYGNDRVMIGDPFASDEELIKVADIIQEKPLSIPVEIYTEDAVVKDKLLNKTHYFRTDNGAYAHRLESSREMAAFDRKIKPENQIKRQINDITVDNENYQRYSGEIQIMLEERPMDERVNVVGKVLDDQLLKLAEKGLKFNFVEKVE